MPEIFSCICAPRDFAALCFRRSHARTGPQGCAEWARVRVGEGAALVALMQLRGAGVCLLQFSARSAGCAEHICSCGWICGRFGGHRGWRTAEDMGAFGRARCGFTQLQTGAQVQFQRRIGASLCLNAAQHFRDACSQPMWCNCGCSCSTSTRYVTTTPQCRDAETQRHSDAAMTARRVTNAVQCKARNPLSRFASKF